MGVRGLLPLEAVKEITQTYRTGFSRRMLRALLHELSAFPIGSVIRLNSGAIVRVVETDPAYPLRPAVEVLYDAEGRRPSRAHRIALRENPILHISSVVYQHELPEERP